MAGADGHHHITDLDFHRNIPFDGFLFKGSPQLSKITVDAIRKPIPITEPMVHCHVEGNVRA